MQKGLLQQYGFPVAAVIVGVILYYSGLLPERNAGAILACAAALLPAPYAGMTLAAIAPRGVPRMAIYGVTYAAALLAVVPTYFAVFPGDPIVSGEVNEEQKTASLGELGGGSYILSVDGVLPEREGEVTAEYRLKVGEKSIDGELWRRFDKVRVGRRGQATEERQRTFNRHFVSLPAGKQDVTLGKTTGSITNMRFQLHQAMVPPMLFWPLAVLLFGVSAYLEARYGTEKTKSLLTTALGFSLFFAYLYPDQVTGNLFIRPAFGSAVGGMFVGIVLGGITSFFVRRMVKSEHAPAATAKAA